MEKQGPVAEVEALIGVQRYLGFLDALRNQTAGTSGERAQGEARMTAHGPTRFAARGRRAIR